MPAEPQQAFQFRTWGGVRPGAGPRRRRARPALPHRAREEFRPYQPLHVTLRMADWVWNLRSQRSFAVIHGALRDLRRRADVRVNEFSIQGNHVHLIVEADGPPALTRAMRAFSIRLARRLNAMMGRRGPVFEDRYYVHVLRTPAGAQCDPVRSRQPRGPRAPLGREGVALVGRSVAAADPRARSTQVREFRIYNSALKGIIEGSLERYLEKLSEVIEVTDDLFCGPPHGYELDMPWEGLMRLPAQQRTWRAMTAYWSGLLSLTFPGRILNFLRAIEAVTSKQDRYTLFATLPTAAVAPLWLRRRFATTGRTRIDAMKLPRRKALRQHDRLVSTHGRRTPSTHYSGSVEVGPRTLTRPPWSLTICSILGSRQGMRCFSSTWPESPSSGTGSSSRVAGRSNASSSRASPPRLPALGREP